MFKNNVARKGTLVAAALSAALVAPSLAPVASAQTDGVNLSSSDGTQKATDAKEINFKRDITIKRGESTSFDLGTIANLPLGTLFELNAGGEIAKLDGSKLNLSAPKSGSTKVQLKANPKIGPSLNIDLNVSAGDATEGTLSSNDGSGSSIEGAGFSAEGQGTLTGSSQESGLPGKCKVALLGLGVPLLALIPVALVSQLAISGASQIGDQLGAQIRQANSAIQSQIGLLNPQVASQVEAANATLKQFGLTAGSAALAVAGAGVGLTLLAGVLAACLGNGSSSSSAPADRGSSWNANVSKKETEAPKAAATN